MTFSASDLRTLFASPFDSGRWTDVLADLFGAREGLLASPRPLPASPTGDCGFHLGAFTTSDGLSVGLYRFDISSGSVLKRKVGLRALVKPFLAWHHHAALVVFVEKDSKLWRFSFICDLDAGATAPKRFTYVFGDPATPHRTPVERFLALESSRDAGKSVSFAAMQEAFSVEALSDQFFREYKEHYEDFVCYVTGKRYVKCGNKFVEKREHPPHSVLYPTFGRDDKRVRDYVKKLLGRLVFLHFLQKKGWLGASVGTWADGDRAFLLNLFEKSSPDQKADFLDGVLERLFFGALNTDRTADGDFFATGVAGVGKCRIPYLNGGLFERDDLDKLRVKFPAEFFERLLKFFAEYNFTIDENDPDEAEVGIDPEMLGRIFENLLEDNKDKGAFYTPKEIVGYMCRRSLLAYLAEGRAEKETAAIEAFLDTRDPAPLPVSLARDLEKRVSDVKICDPAIGSGAFPMGLLRLLFELRSQLKEKMSPAGAAETAALKRSIIENNVYGVDIEKGAVDIARLRFWLSLVVDEEEPSPLPNLDFKIMQGNSLVESWRGHDLSHLVEKKSSGQLTLFEDLADVHRKRLRDLLHEWYSCSDHRERAALRKAIRATAEEQIKTVFSDFSFGDLNLAANTNFFLWHLWFAEVFDKGGFDIVIGNPPYIKEYENRAAFDVFRETSPYYTGKMDIFHGFACHGIDLLKHNGLLCFITQNNWTTNAGAKKMRNKVVSDTRILQLLDFNAWMVFEDAGIQTMVMLFKKDQEPSEYEFMMRVLSPDAEKEDYLSMLGDAPTERVVESHPKLQRTFFKNRFLTFAKEDTLLDKVAEGRKTLFPTEIIQGIVPALDEYFIVDSPKGFTLDERQFIKPFHTGLADRYLSLPVSKYLIYMSAKNFHGTTLRGFPNLLAHFAPHKKELQEAKVRYGTPTKPYFFVHRERDESFFSKGTEKIMSQIRCERPRFYWTNEPFYPSRAMFAIKTDRWNMKYLTGLLNSRLVAFWLSKRGKMQGTLFKVDKEPLLDIPLPEPTPVEQSAIASLVTRILSAKASNPSADTSTLESQIDSLVYRLYGLTPAEIAIVEGEK